MLGVESGAVDEHSIQWIMGYSNGFGLGFKNRKRSPILRIF